MKGKESHCVASFASGVQFRSEIILVISNRTRAAHSFDFEITRMVTDLITKRAKLLNADWSIKGVFFPNFCL